MNDIKLSGYVGLMICQSFKKFKLTVVSSHRTLEKFVTRNFIASRIVPAPDTEPYC